VVAGLVVALHPFAEWAVHVHILHRKARRRGKDQVEPYAARLHRFHHEDPKNIDLVLLPMRSVMGLVGTTGMLTVLARDQRRGASAGVAALSSLLAYEWVHFLIHSPHRPRRAMYRARWRAHRLHHYRNERYWFGVVGTVADWVFGTAPERGDVPVSPTARSLTPV
jgi:sterol desaturase/sphingolipid hydroxylase (fatty acid hydroxylase superfamily)